jgi:DNA-binding protein H-NS
MSSSAALADVGRSYGPKSLSAPSGGPRAAEPLPSSALPLDLAALSDAVIAELLAQGQRELEHRKTKREADFIASTREGAQALGITPTRLAAALTRDGRSKVKPKYWNPANHAERIAGRGQKPKWFTDHIAAGGKPEDMLIPKDER